MKIACFVDEFPPFFRGGLGTYSMEITRQFTKRGHKTTVFSRNRDADPIFEMRDDVEVHRPALYDLSDLLTFINPPEIRQWDFNGQRFYAETILYNLLSADVLVNQLVGKDGREIDLLVSHDWLSSPAGIISKQNLDRPYILHVHSTEQGRNPAGSSTIMGMERDAAMKADRIITVSYAMRDELLRLGYPVEKIHVVYNGVDPEKYNPSRFSARRVEKFRELIGVGDAPMVLFIGRLTPVKGVEKLIRAMPEVITEVPGAKLVVIGRGELEGAISRLVQDLHLEERVILNFSLVPEEERLLYYASCDLAVFPSTYEPFGIVCAEAMSMGKAVVVGAKGTSGFREQVIPSGEEICGFHIDPDDIADIARYVGIVLKNPELRNAMGSNARRRVCAQFTWDMAAERTLAVYRDALDSR